MKITINKAVLVEIVQQNKNKHETEFNAAVKNWVSMIESKLGNILEKAKKYENIDEDLRDTSYKLPKPVNHSESYNKLLSMLKMSQDENIELNMESYSKFVEDDWEWKGEYNALIRNYQ